MIREALKYSVYLPPGYEHGEKKYPVFYLLHGLGGNENSWIDQGEIHQLLDKKISNNQLPPLIVVMPDADKNWFTDDVRGREPYESFILNEFIPFVENQYRIYAVAKYRIVGGYSMGGYGSLLWAMHAPDRFGACLAISAAIWSDEQVQGMNDESYLRTFGKRYSVQAEQRMTSHWKSNSILNLAESFQPKDQVTKYYIVCGDDEQGISDSNARLHILFNKNKIDHEFRVGDGDHSWRYARERTSYALGYLNSVLEY